MSQRQTPPEIDLESLLERGRSIERVPENVRARVLARAHAFVASPPMHPVAPITARTRPVVRRFAIAVALVAAAAIAAAFTLRGRSTQRSDAPPAPSASAPSCPAILPSANEPARGLADATEPSVVTPPTPPKPQRGVRTEGAREVLATELELLRGAHAAYAARDFAHALALVSEQASRFPNGALAEEREALRVRSLAGAGRNGEAGRAATAFAEHFPRSVLLPQIQQFKAGKQ